jgi:hypothetical protein
MKPLVFLLAMTALVGLSGCASIGPPLPPSLELPHPPSDLKAARKGDKVTLRWTVPERTTDRQSVRYLGETRICRSVDSAVAEPGNSGPGHKPCATKVGETPPPADFDKAKKAAGQKLAASFTDTLPSAMEQEHPAGFATYAVEVQNEAGRAAGISNQVRVALAPTLPPFADFAAQPTARGVMVSWKCPGGAAKDGSRVKYLFRIYRRLESSSSETKIAEVDATACALGPVAASGALGAAANRNEEQEKSVNSFLDQTFEWENTYFYRGTVVSVLEIPEKPAVEVEGDDTPEVKVFVHDVFPPAVPTGLQAVFSGPGQEPFIDLIWEPVSDADLDGYNVYRHEEGQEPVKLNSEPVKTPGYRDSQVVTGRTYFYSVSAVDLRGNESARSGVASESVP